MILTNYKHNSYNLGKWLWGDKTNHLHLRKTLPRANFHVLRCWCHLSLGLSYLTQN